MQRREYLTEALRLAEDYRESHNCGEVMDLKEATSIIGSVLDEDTFDRMRYLDAEATDRWARTLFGRDLYNRRIDLQVEEEREAAAKEVRNEEHEEERIGVTTRIRKVRVRLPKCIGQAKRGEVHRSKARHGVREFIGARVEVGLVEKARARGNISQCVEAALKLYFAE